mmetsp:Transcript_24767/g.64496  ORF Transcript_24767/g.64496 Transcript_24767/m.64496 type:complete len:205 (+) Transcript_24767:109-723(+)
MDSFKSLLPVSTSDPPSSPTDVSAASASDPSEYFSGWFGEGQEEKDAWLPSMSRKDRVLAFVGLSAFALICFGLSMMLLPVVVIKARKFALLFSLGSLSAQGSVAMLRGPASFFGYMFSKEKAAVSGAYLGSLLLTVYCAMGLRKTIPTVFCATLQLLILGQFVLGYIPGGTFGIKMLGKLWYKTMTTVVWPMLKRCLPWCAGV